MRYFAHHIGDYRAATAHLSLVEDAVYRRLLDLYYLDEKPLPQDVGKLCRLVGAKTDDERQAVSSVLADFFTETPEGWRQARADRELAAHQERAAKARQNGQLGGRRKTGQQPDANQVGSDVPTEAVAGTAPTSAPEPKPGAKLTTTHEPTPSGKAPSGLSPEEQPSPPVAARASDPQAARAPVVEDDLRIMPNHLKRIPA